MGGGAQPTTQQESLPKWQKPYAQDLLRRGALASERVSDQPFGGAFLAPNTQNEIQGLNSLLRTANTVGRSGVGQDVFDLGQRTIQGDFLNPETNAPLQAMIDRISRSSGERLSENLGLTDAGFSASGGDNLRKGFERAQLAEDSGNTELDAITSLLNTNYGLERGYQNNAGALLDTGVQYMDFPGNRQFTVGTGQKALEQNTLDAALKQFLDRQEAPFRPLIPWANLYNSINGGGTTTVSGGGPSTTSSVLQGTLGGAASGASIGTAALPGWGTAIGAGLGAIGGGIGGYYR